MSWFTRNRERKSMLYLWRRRSWRAPKRLMQRAQCKSPYRPKLWAVWRMPSIRRRPPRNPYMQKIEMLSPGTWRNYLAARAIARQLEENGK